MAAEIISKKCNCCKEIKSINAFYKHKPAKDGYRYICKKCSINKSKIYSNTEIGRKSRRKAKCKYLKTIHGKEQNSEYQKQYYQKNREKLRNTHHIYYEKNRELCKKRTIKWLEKHPEKAKIYYDRKNAKDALNLKMRLRKNISAQIYNSLKKKKNGKPWEILLGYTVVDLENHLEQKFILGMNWSNYGEWEIDHIIPVSHFNFNNVKDYEFRQCWSLDNLQPLWLKDNRSKGNKII